MSFPRRREFTISGFRNKFGMTFKKLLEFLSLSTPRAVVVDFSAIIIALAIIPTAFWDSSPNLCIWRQVILPLIFRHRCPSSGIFANCHCPGCGLTHAMSRLLHADLVGAYQYNHLVYIVAIVILIIYVANIIKLIKARR